MKSLANASFPLLAELTATHSPGEKLAAVSILECFSSTKYLPFLVELIRSEKPFIGFHAARAMEFAVSAMEPRCYPNLAESLDGAMRALDTAVPGSDRMTILIRAKASLNAAMETVTLPAQPPES